MGEVKVISKSSRLVPADKLSLFPGNPRRGDLLRITESLRTNGFYKPLVVQKSTLHILAGNQTFQAALELGIEKVPVTYVDVTDEQAKRIVLADNRTSDRAIYDDYLLAELLLTMEDAFEGTAWTDDEVQDLFDSLEEAEIPPDPESNQDEGGEEDPEEEDPEGTELEGTYTETSEAGTSPPPEIRERVLVLTVEEDEQIGTTFERIMDQEGRETDSECILALCRLWEETIWEGE